MSTMIMSQCWPLQMPPTPKAVLISLADNASDQGVCWPSITTISERTCFSERAVQNAIKWLEAAGILTADRSNGRHTSYRITPAAYAPPQEMHPAAGASVPPQEMPKPPQEMRLPPQEVPSNRKEPSRTVRSNRQGSAAQVAAELLPGLPENLVADFLAVRKAKKLPLTETAVAGLQREAAKAGMSLESAVRLCCERGWASLRADWIRDQPTAAAPQKGALPRLSA
ncbi:helix-turn-helix domain-containing protein [Stenotrophomonas sp. VV52]|uniref:helix-turn-helix domain-containing protein n=1 Tax=Stenotrophomonas sp. VV52 TaxID=2066958 RepID=UPI000C9EA019|nr:helix-turn-helix domain-containing protein [Stenotrophomonas sp. VV52]